MGDVELNLSPEIVLGPNGAGIIGAMRAGLDYLTSRDQSELLAQIGRRVDVSSFTPVSKLALQDSYGGSESDAPDDLLVGQGLFYITEQGKLYLDCTSGHYQMLWGYRHPELLAAAAAAVEAGIIWDNHCNLPQTPVKLLAHKLSQLASDADSKDPLDTVLLGCATGSVACAAALKIQLMIHQRDHSDAGRPVIVVLEGNYHGTDMIAQNLRGMWEQYVKNLEVVSVEPNEIDELKAVFDKFGRRVAGFWAEPIMMNREAIEVSADYLQLARRLCNSAGALMCIDEIQTGFWQPDVFAFRRLGIEPDLVIAGKGMTAGFHPQSALLLKSRLDVLATYDAISTNGSASLPCYIALCCIAMIEDKRDEIVTVGDRFAEGMRSIAAAHPDVLVDARGLRHMMGLKFRRAADALAFQARALDAGLWVRAHAYHEGHSTVLTKLSLAADEEIVDFVLDKLRSLLAG